MSNELEFKNSGIYEAYRTPQPIEVFVVDYHGGNFKEMIEWREGSVSSIGVQAGGAEGSVLRGPFISVFFNRDGEVSKVPGVSFGGDFLSFQEDTRHKPEAVLVKYNNKAITVAKVYDLERQGYVLK